MEKVLPKFLLKLALIHIALTLDFLYTEAKIVQADMISLRP